MMSDVSDSDHPVKVEAFVKWSGKESTTAGATPLYEAPPGLCHTPDSHPDP